MVIPFTNAAHPTLEENELCQNRKEMVLDLDGTLHNFGGIGDKAVFELYARNKVKAVREVYPQWNISDNKIIQIGKDSNDLTGDGKLLYADIAADIELIDPLEKNIWREKMLRAFHRYLYEDACRTVPQMFEPDKHLLELMEQLQERFRFSLLTQSCKIHWGIPTLERSGLGKFIHPQNCFDFHDSGYNLKGFSSKPVRDAVMALGASFSQVIFVEDSKKNIERIKRDEPSLLGVLVHPDLTISNANTLIDIHRPDFVSFLEYAKDKRSKPFQKIEHLHTKDFI